MSLVEITTLDGSMLSIEAKSVFRIVPGNPSRLDYDGGQQETSEPVAKLTADLAAASVKLIKLTAPNGDPIYLNAAAVTAVYTAMDGVDAPGAKTAVTVGGQRQAVAESPDAVEAML